MNRLFNEISRQKHFCGAVSGLRGSSPAFLAAGLADRLARDSARNLAVIVPSEEQAAAFEQDITLFTTCPVKLYPGFDIPPYTPISPDPATVARRIATLYQLVTATEPTIMIIPAEALLRRVIPRDKLCNLAELVLAGEDTDQNQLISRLVAGGYEQVALVQNAGEFSRRGGILDIFPPSVDEASQTGKTNGQSLPGPVRLDFFGDTIESIRCFDPISQRSLQEIDELTILPVSDTLYPAPEDSPANTPATRARAAGSRLGWPAPAVRELTEWLSTGRRFPGIEFYLPLFHENPAEPLDFLAKDTLLLLKDPLEINRSLELAWERIEQNHQESLKNRPALLPPAELFVTGADLSKRIAGHPNLSLTDFQATETSQPALNLDGLIKLQTQEENQFHIPSTPHTLLRQELELERRSRGLMAPLAEQISNWQQQGERVILSSRSRRHADQLMEFLEQRGIRCAASPAPLTDLSGPADLLLVCPDIIHRGFDLPRNALHVLSEAELFGEKRLAKRRSSPRKDSQPVSFEELSADDIIVHRTHGIGSYKGLITMTVDGIEGDYLKLSYRNDDKLYVPIDRLNTVHKYKGLSDQAPKLDKLGSSAWTDAKRKVKAAVWKVAHELLDLYARRKLVTGRKFSAPDQMYSELEESFPFDETPGQLKAITDVIDDLTSDKVMDRLVCGDVGYGKTEVAVRAAFKVITDGMQVAVLVPTTVLAEQHAATFRERLAGFAVNIRSMSRFRTASEQKKTLAGLADGTVDLVIGTHRLLSNDISFKHLGLLIIDEEHRFGVRHKEKIKKIRAGVDVLTLTATPIPRTLQLSLLGIRDLSVISSPPQHRRSVKTFVAKFDDLVIKEAISREMQRGGQVFVVHNRVRTIGEMARRIQDLRPECRIAVAHGQMPGQVLEDIMLQFVNHEIDVLICTTIIESGLDIPNANTIIITRADRLGLAGIYQLRGRVGRSSEQAYAYLLVPSLEGLSRDAQRRLRALMDYNELGGGFKLAMSDLQIRGGGNILGESQSGNIAAVGYDLYLELLQQTVDDLKRRAESGEELTGPNELDPEINLKIPALIPADYVRDTDQRYICYRKITSSRTAEELADIKDELRDRYGALPIETLNLLEIISLKGPLQQLSVTKLDQGDKLLVLSFGEGTKLKPEKLLGLVQNSKGGMRLTPDSRLVITAESNSSGHILRLTKKTLRSLIENAT